MKYYLFDGGTVIVETDSIKPENEESPEFKKWLSDLMDSKWIPVFPKLEEELHEKGKGDWDELIPGKDFALLAVPVYATRSMEDFKEYINKNY